MKIVANIDAGKILRQRGLQPNGTVQQMFTQECAKEMDPYVPMQSGTLKDTRFVGQSYVEYNQPYARYLYYGELMLAPNGSSWAKKGERKYLAGKPLDYHGAPMRGKLWDVRMWRDRKDKLMGFLAKACGGRAK